MSPTFLNPHVISHSYAFTLLQRSFDDLPEGDWRRGVPRFGPDNWPKINKLIDAFQAIASKYSATPAQLTIAWLLSQGDDIIPIPGSKQIKYIEENLGAASLLNKLKEEDLKELRTLANAIDKDLSGFDRYPAGGNHTLLQETPEEK